MLQASTIKASESIPLYQQPQKNKNPTVILKTLVTETNGSGKTKSKLIGPSTRVSLTLQMYTNVVSMFRKKIRLPICHVRLIFLSTVMRFFSEFWQKAQNP